MQVKVQDLKVGQSIVVFNTIEVVHAVVEYETGVMVFYASQKDNPFLSSRYGSYAIDTMVQAF